MKRRSFIKGVGAGGALALSGTLKLDNVFAAEAMTPSGKKLGDNETLLVGAAKIVDVANGVLFPETALLIKGWKIEKRLMDEEAAQTQADRKIDARGRYLIPGFINAHCHLCLPGIGAASMSLLSHAGEQMDRNCSDCVTHGITTVRDQLGGQQMLIERQKRISVGSLLGPRIMRGIAVQIPNGYGFQIPSFIYKDAIIAAKNAKETRDAVKRALDLGADHIKLFLQYQSLFQSEEPMPTMTDEMLAATVDEATKYNKTVAVHQTSLDGHRRAVRVGIQSLEHMPIDGELTDEDLKMFVSGGHFSVPTTSVAWALTFPFAGDANFQDPNTQRLYNDKMKRLDSVIDEFLVRQLTELAHYTFRNYSQPGYFDVKHRMPTPSARFFNASGAIGGKNMIKMYEAGCKMGCGNDGGVPFTWPGGLALEMLLNRDAGIKTADILRSATMVNAQIIGLGETLGTLDSNKIADVIFLDGNPLENLENVVRVDGVLQSGRLTYTNKRIMEE